VGANAGRANVGNDNSFFGTNADLGNNGINGIFPNKVTAVGSGDGGDNEGPGGCL
jgi:hypothetical protein